MAVSALASEDWKKSKVRLTRDAWIDAAIDMMVHHSVEEVIVERLGTTLGVFQRQLLLALPVT